MGRREWSRIRTDVLARVAVVSPHLDDAVLSAGRFLAANPGTVVVTAFAGTPPGRPLSRWDRRCGFAEGDDVAAARRQEDERALALLACQPVWLEHVEAAYLDGRPQVDLDDLAATLDAVVAASSVSAVCVPFGLVHPDHVLTHQAALRVRQRRGDLAWFCYEDQPFRYAPGALAQRLREMSSAGLVATPAVVPLDATNDRKRAAYSCYTSQIGPLDEDWHMTALLDANTGEGWWRVDDAPRD
ncbi:MAG TPA: PIG-L family deacetylase [Acidimicrobiia bacterium]|nr:PIG-L family deacetylase [Acidimicrobiia bacterium]